MQSDQHTPFNWLLWLQWVLTTTLGWLAGIALLPPAFGAGIALGITQWLILRTRFPHTGWWIIASAAGWTTGWGIAFTLRLEQNDALVAAIVGSVMGLAQWLILRHWLPRAGWWVIISALGWSIGLSTITTSPYTGLTVGIVTGIGFELLNRYVR